MRSNIYLTTSKEMRPHWSATRILYCPLDFSYNIYLTFKKSSYRNWKGSALETSVTLEIRDHPNFFCNNLLTFTLLQEIMSKVVTLFLDKSKFQTSMCQVIFELYFFHTFIKLLIYFSVWNKSCSLSLLLLSLFPNQDN